MPIMLEMHTLHTKRFLRPVEVSTPFLPTKVNDFYDIKDTFFNTFKLY